ncbi:hypothetical protein RND81_02G236000 [Saponaria officinalis]|uniref:RING-type E3 ubiquitin transferase n=1 Tax=Saponaria officinalis TaxID=3572 RepID=A0AAW1MWU7_SAPOF
MSLVQSQNHYNSQQSTESSSNTKISPAILFIIIILAVIFFICGLLHLIVRFIMKKRSSPSSSVSQSSQYPDNISDSDMFRRQLQQLFHLHDSGLDQAFIDALPVFQYKEIVGLNEAFDCAVCLCEFCENDKLRLLPLCSHAFHIECIDKWLLSNSTCPLCRGALYTPGLGVENPVFDFDGKCTQKSFEIVRLGKFRSTSNENEGDTSSSSFDVRRCYSMGSYEYVVDDLVLQVGLCRDPVTTNGISKNGISAIGVSSGGGDDVEGRKINIGSKKESLSVSKIWLWSKKGRFSNSSNVDFGGVDLSLPWTNKGEAPGF